MTRKTTSVIPQIIVLTIILAIAILLGGCDSNGAGGGTGGDSSSDPIEVSVSAGIGAVQSTVAAMSSDTVTMSSEEFFKTERQAASRGTLVDSYTPESFVLDLDTVVLYTEIGTNDYDTIELLELSRNPDGGIVPKHIDLAYADNFIRGVQVTSDTYDGVSMQFLPSGDGDSNDGFYVRSVVGVELPAAYDAIDFGAEAGEVTGIANAPENLRFFGFEALQPFDTGAGFLSYITIGSNIEESGIQNPAGEIGTWVNPVTETTGNAVSLYFATDQQLDFSAFTNPEIVFDWDLDDLVQIWDAGTPGDLSDDIVTFNVTDPFPFGISVIEDQGVPADTGSDTTAPSEVLSPAISGPTTWNTLQWINPRDPDFKEVVIVRKADSAPTGPGDGEEVYRNYQPNYVDATGTSGVHYYYLVRTVDFAGNESDGVVLDQVQH